MSPSPSPLTPRMFKTDMQRLSTFLDVRKDPTHLPPEIDRCFPQFRPILEAMLSSDPRKRPTAQELIDMPVFTKQSKQQFAVLLSEKDRRIRELERHVGFLPILHSRYENSKRSCRCVVHSALFPYFTIC